MNLRQKYNKSTNTPNIIFQQTPEQQNQYLNQTNQISYQNPYQQNFEQTPQISYQPGNNFIENDKKN